MLSKIILKNFKSNFRNYIIFFVSNIIAIAELFVFWGIGNVVRDAVTDNIVGVALAFDFKVASGLVIFITVFLMIYSMRHYVKVRMKDYTTFIVLGMRRKTSILLLLAEYSIGCLASLIAGLLLGTGLLYGTQEALHRLNPDFLVVTKADPVIYRNTCALSLVIMVLVFLALMIWMEGRDLSTLISPAERNEKKPVGKKWWIIVLAGVGLIAFSAYYYTSSDKGYVYAHITWIIGLFLVVYFGLALILESLRKRQNFYIRHILQLNQLYSRYQNSLLIMLILLVMNFCSLTYLAVEISGTLPLNQYRENYRYDAVWFAQEKDQEFTEEIIKAHQGEVKMIPMIRLTTFYDAEHIGVSASDYEELTGKKVALSGQEIVVGIEDQEFEKTEQITDKSKKKVYQSLYIGKYIDRGDTLPNRQDPELTYDVKDIFTQSVIGQYSIDQAHENMIVLSDEYFEEKWEQIRQNPEESSVLELFTFPKETREQACAELEEYVEKYGVKTNFKIQGTMEQTLYLTDDFLHDQEMRLTFSLLSKVFLFISLFVSSVFVVGIKTLSEMEYYQKRYEFLDCMGMKKKQQRRLIRFENAMLSYIAEGAALIVAFTYLGAHLYGLQEVGDWVRPEFWGYWAGIIVGYLMANYLVQRLFAWYMIRKLGKGRK